MKFFMQPFCLQAQFVGAKSSTNWFQIRKREIALKLVPESRAAPSSPVLDSMSIGPIGHQMVCLDTGIFFFLKGIENFIETKKSTNGYFKAPHYSQINK